MPIKLLLFPKGRALDNVFRWLSVIAALTLSSMASAHLMQPGRGTINIVEKKAFTVLSTPIACFSGVDDDGDERIGQLELSVHLDSLKKQIAEKIYFLSGEDKLSSENLFLKVESDEVLNGDMQSRDLTILSVTPLPLDSGHVEFVNTCPSQTHAAHKTQVLVTDKVMNKTNVLTFDSERVSARLFAQPHEILLDFFSQGFLHLLEGYDHVLFLLTILIGTYGIRRWLIVLTGFTVAHGLTLTLFVLHIVRVPSVWVESLIAVSIVIVGALKAFDIRLKTPWEAGIVFAFGLFHGMGFAGSMDRFSTYSDNLGLSIVGFNVGIEVGQLFIILVLAFLIYGLPAYFKVKVARFHRILACLCVLAGVALLAANLHAFNEGIDPGIGNKPTVLNRVP